MILFGFPALGHTISQALAKAYAKLNAARKKNSTTASTVPSDSVVETYSASSPRSANSGMMNGAGSVTFKGVKFDLTGADGSNLFAKEHTPKVSGEDIRSDCRMESGRRSGCVRGRDRDGGGQCPCCAK